MAATTKKAAPKNTAAKKAPANGGAGSAAGASFDPVKIDTSVAPEVEQVTLFEIDGTAYTIPKYVRPNIAMAYLRDVNEYGEENAIARAMEALLGSEAMNALADCEAVGEDEMAQIMQIVSDKLFATMNSLAGKSGAGQNS